MLTTPCWLGCVPPQTVLWGEDEGSSGTPDGSTNGRVASSSSTGSIVTGPETGTEAGTEVGTGGSSSGIEPQGTTGPGDASTSSSSTGSSAGSCALEDSFEGAGPSAAWSDFGDGSLVQLTYDGQLTFQVPTSAADDYRGLISESFDLEGMAVRMRVLQRPPGPPIQLFLGVRDDAAPAAPHYDILIDENFRPRIVTDGMVNQLLTEPFDPAQTPWVRTRFEPVDVVFETSEDGVTWVERARGARGDGPTNAQVAVSAGSFDDNPVAADIVVDDVSVCPVR